ALHTAQTEELELRNKWAEHLNHELEHAMARVSELQDELRTEQAAAREVVAQYEAKLSELDADLEARTRWAIDTEQRLTKQLEDRCTELAKCIELLHQAEQTLEERTHWALALDQDRQQLEAKLGAVAASRWIRMGRAIGLGPRLGNS